MATDFAKKRDFYPCCWGFKFPLIFAVQSSLDPLDSISTPDWGVLPRNHMEAIFSFTFGDIEQGQSWFDNTTATWYNSVQINLVARKIGSDFYGKC